MHVNFRILLNIEDDYTKTAEANDNIRNANVSYETNIFTDYKKNNNSSNL